MVALGRYIDNDNWMKMELSMKLIYENKDYKIYANNSVYRLSHTDEYRNNKKKCKKSRVTKNYNFIKQFIGD